MKKILCVFGTRPEAIKMAPVIKKLEDINSEIEVKVCVSAQHRQMLDPVLDIFGIKSHYDLNIMVDEQSLYYITTTCLLRIEKVLDEEKPDLVLIQGDTTTTFSCALAAFYKKISVGHIEAGLRSYDLFNPYPEEVNRVFTDKLSDLLFAPTELAKENLLKEGIPEKKIFVTGNTVIDALYFTLKKEYKLGVLGLGDLSRSKLILVTTHRRENFGKPIKNICYALREIADSYPEVTIVYPVHLNPNIQKTVKKILFNHPRIYLTTPLNYIDFVNLMRLSYLVVTDSGGLQEEAPVLGKPVLVLRKVTERPEGIKSGNVRIIGTDKESILKAIKTLLENAEFYNSMAQVKNIYGDGKASERIVGAIKYYFGLTQHRPVEFKA